MRNGRAPSFSNEGAHRLLDCVVLLYRYKGSLLKSRVPLTSPGTADTKKGSYKGNPLDRVF
jgi:hypothetical protein